MIKNIFNSEDIVFYDYDAEVIEYRVFCPIFLISECDDDGEYK